MKSLKESNVSYYIIDEMVTRKIWPTRASYNEDGIHFIMRHFNPGTGLGAGYIWLVEIPLEMASQINKQYGNDSLGDSFDSNPWEELAVAQQI